jgi:preflagellin peptidase FlaK
MVLKVQTISGMLAVTRTSLALIFLLYASLSDYKTREVSNTVWIVFAPSAFALTLVELFLYPYETSGMLLYGLSFGLTATFAVILFYSGGFGGADAKALMCLALALPFYPENLFTPMSGTISPISQTFFPITVFSNSVLLAAATAVYMFLCNVFGRKRTSTELFEGHENESFGRKVLVLITGYKVSVDKLKEKWHLYPMEDIEQSDENTFRRKLVVIPKDEGRSAIVERLTKAVESGKIQNSVWATPGLPMLIFITAGLIMALFFGDIVWICVKFLLG